MADSARNELRQKCRMLAQSSSSRRFRFQILEAASWAFLVPGIFLFGVSALDIIGLQHVTTNFLYGSSAALLLLLTGLLMNACPKEFSPQNPLNSEG